MRDAIRISVCAGRPISGALTDICLDPRGGGKFPSEACLVSTTPLTFPTFPKNPPPIFPYLPQNRLGVKIVTICREWLREWSDSQLPPPPRARIQAIAIRLDRSWGKAAQPHTGEDGDIRVTLRTITEGKP
jgi:hypothetical protein